MTKESYITKFGILFLMICIFDEGIALYCDHDDGWKIYNGACYKFSNDSGQWQDAWVDCKNHGSILVQIVTPSQQMIVYDLALENNGDSWLGLHSVYQGGNVQWLWANGSTSFTTYWGNQQPNIVSGQENNTCAVMHVGNGVTKAWIARSCDEYKRYFCQKSAETCAPGWEAFGTMCYQFHPRLSLSHQSANSHCKAQGAKLIEITSQDIQTFVNGYLSELQEFESSTIWIGLTADIRQTMFHWNDGDAVTFSNWVSTQQSSAYARCVYIYTTLHNQGKWTSTSYCTQLRSFICQIPSTMTGQQGTIPTSNVIPGPSTPRQWSAKCGPHWEDNPSLGFCYQFSDDQKTWDDAQAYCRQNGGNLVSISSATEQDYVTGRTHTMSSIGWWIGANYKNLKWHWADNSTMVFLNWSPGEPNNDQNSDDCGIIYSEKSSWNDFYCNTKNGFICKKTLSELTPTPVGPTTSMTEIKPQQTTEGSKQVFADNHLFRRADANRDNLLSQQEFYTIFDHWDINGDGKISIDEFSRGWLADDWDDEELRFADFRLFDINHDNHITDIPDLHHLFTVFDTNNSSSVSEHEFKDQWERLFED